MITRLESLSNHGHHLFHQLIGDIDAGHRLILQEVIHDLLIVLGVGALVLVAVHLVEVRQIVLLEALVLCCGEAELLGAAEFLNQGLCRGCGLRDVLGHGSQGEGVLGLGVDVLTVADISSHVGAVGLQGTLAETVGEHLAKGAVHIAVDVEERSVLQAVGEHVLLNHHLHHRLLEFLILVDDHDGLGIVGNLLVNHGSGILRILDVAEELLDLGFHLVDVNVADDDDALV